MIRHKADAIQVFQKFQILFDTKNTGVCSFSPTILKVVFSLQHTSHKFSYSPIFPFYKSIFQKRRSSFLNRSNAREFTSKEFKNYSDFHGIERYLISP